MTNESSSYTKHDDLSLAEWQFLPGYFGGIPRVRPLTEKKKVILSTRIQDSASVAFPISTSACGGMLNVYNRIRTNTRIIHRVPM